MTTRTGKLAIDLFKAARQRHSLCRTFVANPQGAVRNAQRHTQILARVINVADRNTVDENTNIFRRLDGLRRRRDHRIVVHCRDVDRGRRRYRRRAVRDLVAEPNLAVEVRGRRKRPGRYLRDLTVTRVIRNGGIERIRICHVGKQLAFGGRAGNLVFEHRVGAHRCAAIGHRRVSANRRQGRNIGGHRRRSTVHHVVISRNRLKAAL